MRLGTLLLRDGIITLTQLEQALRVQVLSGGRLGTNLVELGFIDLSTLGRHLAQVRGAPLAIAERFENADRSLLQAFSPEMADHCTAIPLGVDPQHPTRILVAMRDPDNQEMVSAIEKHLQSPIVPYIAGELRLFYYLEKYYSIQRKTRFTRSPMPSEGPPKAKRERRVTQPYLVDSGNTVTILPSHNNSEDENNAEIDHHGQVTLDYSIAVMEEASHRDQLANALLSYCAGRFECVALFIVRAGHAIGWKAKAKGLGEDALDRLNLPLQGVSVFQEAHDSKKAYRGKVLTPGHPQENALWGMLALQYVPTDIQVVPIVLAGRVVNLVYAHRLPGAAVNSFDDEGLLVLAHKAEEGYLRLIASTHLSK